MADRLDFRKLRYVVAVAEEHSLTGAAKLLSITQPALTRCLTDVEDYLGMQLFHRLPRGISLTEEGEKFVSRAKTLLDDLEALGEDFRLGASASRGHLRLGVAPGPFLSIAASSLADFASAHPEVDITTSAGRPQEVVPKLETGELDIVISTTNYLKQWPDLPKENIAPLQFSYMMRRGHPMAEQGYLTKDDVLQYPSILPATSDWMHRDIASLHERLGLPPTKATYFTDDFNLIFSLLNRTDAYFPLVTITNSMMELSEQFSLLTLSRAISNQYLCLAYSKTRAPSPLIKMLLPILRDMLGDGH